jgi:transcription antitermination protein NusB
MVATLKNSFPENAETVSDIKPIRYAELSRRDIRSLIFHLLYAAESHEYNTPLISIVDNLNRGFDLDIPLESESVRVSQAIIDERDMLDAKYAGLLANWRPDRVSVCTKLILRLGLWELLYTDTDPRIIINEAIELAKCFAEDDAYRFINGLLDRAIKEGLIRITDTLQPKI